VVEYQFSKSRQCERQEIMHRIMVKEYFENWQNRMKRHSWGDNIMKDL
jgi:hypothetical protein